MNRSLPAALLALTLLPLVGCMTAEERRAQYLSLIHISEPTRPY